MSFKLNFFNFLLGSVFIFIQIYCANSAAYRVTFNNIECDPNPSFFSNNYTCHINKYDNGTTSLNIRMFAYKELRNGFLNIQALRKDNGFSTTAVNTTQNYCDFVSGTGYNPFVRVVSQWLRKALTKQIRCPFKGQFDATDFFLDLSDIPGVIKPGAYSVLAKFYKVSPYQNIVIVKINFDINREL